MEVSWNRDRGNPKSTMLKGTSLNYKPPILFNILSTVLFWAPCFWRFLASVLLRLPPPQLTALCLKALSSGLSGWKAVTWPADCIFFWFLSFLFVCPLFWYGCGALIIPVRVNLSMFWSLQKPGAKILKCWWLRPGTISFFLFVSWHLFWFVCLLAPFLFVFG